MVATQNDGRAVGGQGCKTAQSTGSGSGLVGADAAATRLGLIVLGVVLVVEPNDWDAFAFGNHVGGKPANLFGNDLVGGNLAFRLFLLHINPKYRLGSERSLLFAQAHADFDDSGYAHQFRFHFVVYGEELLLYLSAIFPFPQ